MAKAMKNVNHVAMGMITSLFLNDKHCRGIQNSSLHKLKIKL